MATFLPQARINIRPQPINFAPAANGLVGLADSFREKQNRQNQQAVGAHVADGKFGQASQEAARQGNLDQSIALRGVQQQDQQQQQESERKLALRAAGFAQNAIDRAQTPEQKSAAVQRLLSMHENFGAELQSAGVDVNNPDQVSAFVQAEAAEFVDPAKRAEMDARLGLIKAQTARAQQSTEQAGATFGRTGMVFTDADGRQSTIQFGSDGTRLIKPIDGLTRERGVKTVNTGTEQLILDGSTGQTKRVIQNDIVGEARQKAEGKKQGDIVANARKARGTMFSLEQQWKTVDAAIDLALKNVGTGTAGLLGSASAHIPGTPAYDLARTIDTIKSNIGFDKLQDMRNNSPTGGALGQVSEFENRLLQSVRNSLEQGQSAEQLATNLRLVKQDLIALQNERRRAFSEDYGNDSLDGAQQSSPRTTKQFTFNPTTGQLEPR